MLIGKETFYSHFSKRWCLLLIITLIFTCITNPKANATPRGVDVFSTNTNNQASQQTPVEQKTTPIAAWFDKFDQLWEQYRPTEKDQIILTRPLMQQAERVQQWTNTASKISKNYMLLAKSIRNLTVPPGMSDIKEYRDLVAEWFEDSASVYQDLIRPRPPAKTIEDLQDEIGAIRKRSDELANNIPNLKNMERELRKKHGVRPSIQDAAVQPFVTGK